MTEFLEALLERCEIYRNTACLTLTAIHPNGQHRTPSRHIPLNQPDRLHDALATLLEANRLGWGAYAAIGLRRQGLTRYHRGGEADVLALPAVFVDVDDPTSTALKRLQKMTPQPSCITFTGGGFHAYWWLDEPLSDMKLARQILRQLQRISGGDALSVAQSLRLVGSRNTKSERTNALCQIIYSSDQYYPLEVFTALLPRQSESLRHKLSSHPTASRPSGETLNPSLVRVVANQLIHMGYGQHGDWLSGPCLYPSRHQREDAHHSFGFNARSGYGNCFRCGSILLKDICNTLGIQPANYGGLFI